MDESNSCPHNVAEEPQCHRKWQQGEASNQLHRVSLMEVKLDWSGAEWGGKGVGMMYNSSLYMVNSTG